MKTLDIKRMGLLFKKEIFERFKIVLLGYAFIIGSLFIILLLNGLNGGGELWQDFDGVFNFTLFIVGIFAAGMAFTNFRTKESTISYLILPASQLEKVITQIILTSIIVIVTYTLAFYLAYGLFFITSKLFFTFEIGGFNPFNTQTFMLIKFLVIIQSIFIAGSSYFRRMPIFFTGLYLFIFVIGLSLIVGAVAYLVTQDVGGGVNIISKIGDVDNMSIVHNSESVRTINLDLLWFGKIANFFISFILAPIFWTIAYFNVKEKEV